MHLVLDNTYYITKTVPNFLNSIILSYENNIIIFLFDKQAHTYIKLVEINLLLISVNYRSASFNAKNRPHCVSYLQNPVLWSGDIWWF